jgi:hypothetical protein
MVRFVTGIVLVPALVTPALAQIPWANPVPGNWSDATKWTGGNIPDNAAEVAQIAVAGSYAVEFNGNFNFGGLALTNANATVNIVPNVSMGIGGTTWTNDGLVVLNSTATNVGTYLRSDVAALTMSGSGTLRLNANPSNLDTAQMNTLNGGFVITNAPTHSIKGTGRVRIAMTNQGLMEADGAGQNLDLIQFNKTNTGTMRASGGGILGITGIGLANTGGNIVATGANSVVSASGSIVSGGTLTGAAAGVVRNINSTYSGVTLEGSHEGHANATFIIAGAGITNNGTITVNPNADNLGTYFRTDSSSATLGGTGTLRLNAHPSNLDTAQMNTNNGAFVLTNGSSHTIRGVGHIRIATINDGVIRADGPTENINHGQFGKTNNSLIESLNGGLVQFTGIGVTNSPTGVIRATGANSVAFYNGSGISGGTLSALNGGVGSISNSTFSDLTVSGPHQINANTTLAIAGAGITNNGTITVNPTGQNLGTFLRTDVTAATIGGNGTISLNAEPSNVDTAQLNTNNGAFVLTIGPNQTVNGTGAIRINTTNNGLIDANNSGEVLALRQFPKTNNATMRATNGGVLSVEGIGIANNSEIRADGAGSVVSYSGSGGVTGGQLIAAGGGVGSFSNFTLAGATISGPHHVNANTTLAIAGAGITNNGTITVNPTGQNLGTFLRTDVAAATIGGNGTVQLNAHPSNLDTAQLNTPNGAFGLTIAEGQTLSGSGAIRVSLAHQGRLAPGSAAAPIGRIEQRQFGFSMAATSEYVVDVGGVAAGQFDTFGAAGSATLDGNLIVNSINGFVPQRGDEFVVLTANPRLGDFEHIIAPPIDDDTVWRIRYTPTAAILSVTCPGDIDGDHVIELPDLATVLRFFGTPAGAGGEEGDADGDGDVDLVDLAIVLIGFGAPCP